MNPTYDEIQSANSLRGNEVRKTPLVYSQTFSDLTGSQIYLKAEFQQKTGSFKIRGAYYKIRLLSTDEKKHGVVAASAGNHAQGVAFASALEKIKCTIVMPKNASPSKVSATKGYGANVILEGINYDEASAKAKEIASNRTTVDNIVQTGHDTEKRRAATNSKFALCGQNRKFDVRFFYEHLSWQTNPSPKTRTAQTCGTLPAIAKKTPRIQELSATNRPSRFVVWKHKIITD